MGARAGKGRQIMKASPESSSILKLIKAPVIKVSLGLTAGMDLERRDQTLLSLPILYLVVRMIENVYL